MTAAALARLHTQRIAEGFLPTLGIGFLTRVYRRIERSPRAYAVAVEEDGTVVAFAAGTTDVGAFYREFLLHDGLAGAILAAPHAMRAWRPAMETLRYPAATNDLPAAEILAVATADQAAGRGYGSRTVRAVTDELVRRGAPAVKVTLATDNETAQRMYERCGYRRAREMQVHGARRSTVMVWTPS